MANLDALRDHLKNGADWEKIETDVPGVFIVKIPGTKNRSGRLMVEINPVDSTTGMPKKRKGLFVADFEMYLQFREALEDDRVAKVIKTLNEINPPEEGKQKKKIEL